MILNLMMILILKTQKVKRERISKNVGGNGPLQPIRMSIPSICQEAHTRQCQDVLMHILYSGNSEGLLKSLIVESINNIVAEHPASDGVRQALVPFIPTSERPMPPALLRAVFFILLNQDSKMRDSLCTKRTLPYLPTLCPHKACRFYDSLKDSVVTEWVRNESIHLLDFVESLKETYLVS
jgi:hypothetical protein